MRSGALGERPRVPLLDARHVAPALERVAAERRIGGHAGHRGVEDRLPCPERVERRREVGREVASADRPGASSPSQGRARKSIGSKGTQRPAQRFEVPPSRRATAVCGSKWWSGLRLSATARSSAAGSGPAPPLSSTSTRKPRSASASAVTMPTGARADDVDVRGELPERREAGPSSRIMRSGRLRRGVRDPGPREGAVALAEGPFRRLALAGAQRPELVAAEEAGEVVVAEPRRARGAAARR